MVMVVMAMTALIGAQTPSLPHGEIIDSVVCAGDSPFVVFGTAGTENFNDIELKTQRTGNLLRIRDTLGRMHKRATAIDDLPERQQARGRGGQ